MVFDVTLLVVRKSVLLSDVIVLERRDIFTIQFARLALEEVLGKFLSGPGDAALVSFANGSAIRVGHGDEEVGRRLTVGGLVPHVDEVLARTVGRPEVGHFALVDDGDLVEELVERLASLVDGDDGGVREEVGARAEGADVFEGGGGVEAAG